jgi:hypothetical protein
MAKKIKISKYLYDKCVAFAHDRVGLSKSCYAYRGESRVDKMIEDIICGTLGEWAVYKDLNRKNRKCTKPDMKIYEGRRKSFSADLISDYGFVHVKSQSLASVERYGKSWLFQKSDSLYSKPSEEDILAFTSVDLDKREVEILGYCDAKDVSDYKRWGECKVPFYAKTKVALYLEDLEDLLYKL